MSAIIIFVKVITYKD